MASRKKAFTLIELLAVIAIISLLAGLVFTGAENAIKKAKHAKTRSAIDSLNMALTNFERDMGSFDVKVGDFDVARLTGPMQQRDDDKRIAIVRILSGKEFLRDGTVRVDTRVREDLRWQGPYLDPKPREIEPKNKVDFKRGQLVDAWGNPLMIRIKRDNYDKMMRYRPDSFEIWSWGPNEIDDAGKGDDITNWE